MPPSAAAPSHEEAGAVHEARIRETLNRVWRREGFEAVEHRTPVAEIIEREPDPERDGADAEEAQRQRERRLVAEARNETLHRFLRFCFQDGPHLLDACKRLYMIARHYEPETVGWMNGTDLGDFFGEERATVSARDHRILGKLFARAGDPEGKTPAQRGREARRNLAAASQGNRSRATGNPKALRG